MLCVVACKSEHGNRSSGGRREALLDSMKWSSLDYLSSRSANDRALSARQPPALWGGKAERHGGFHDNISQMSSVVPHRAAALHKLGGKKKNKKP